MTVKKHGESETFDPTDMSMEEADAQVYQQPERRISTALTSIRVLQTGGLTIGGFTMTRSGLQISASVNTDDWERVGGIIVDMGKSIQWLLGDWLAFGVDREYAVTYEKVAELTGYEVPTLRNMVYVCQNVNLSLRSDKLKFGHHQLVAPLAPHEQLDWLQKAAVGKWSISKMRKEMTRERDGEPTPLSPADEALDVFYKYTAEIRDAILKFRDNAEYSRDAARRLAALRTMIDQCEKIMRGESDA